MFKIKEMLEEERPRERLVQYGVRSLSNVELLAILLRTGTKEQSVLSLSTSVLNKLNSIYDLNLITVEELCQVKGIKEAKAATLLAGIELGRRLSEIKKRKFTINSPLDVYNLLKEVHFLEQENLFGIYLDSKMQVIKYETLYVGTLNQISIHPREIFKRAIKLSSNSIIIAHNHPSGDAIPSRADKQVTEEIKKAAEFVHIPLIDHIIIGKNEYYSIEEGKLFYI